MTRTFKLSAIAAAAFIAAPAFAAAALDANLELDTKAQGQGRGVSQGGRVEINVSGKAGGDAGFVAGRASVLAGKSGGAGVDDMWGQIGTSTADVKFGRFEAADLFPLGKDVYVDDAGSAGGYRANTLRGRHTNSAAHLALTVNAAPGVSLEVGVVETKEAGAVKGVRPAVSFKAGPATVKLGFESGQTNATTTPVAAAQKFDGFGATVNFALAGGSVNLNASSGKNKATNVKSSSFGANGTFGAAGIGFIQDKTGTAKDTTIYAAYSLPLFNTGATVTPAISSSSSNVTGVQNKSGVAVRVNYNF